MLLFGCSDILLWFIMKFGSVWCVFMLIGFGYVVVWQKDCIIRLVEKFRYVRFFSLLWVIGLVVFWEFIEVIFGLQYVFG